MHGNGARYRRRMTELRVVATIVAKPGSEDAVRDALVALAASSRAEDGCLSYELFESAAAPSTFVTIETWTGQEALDAHMTSRHVTAALATVGEQLASAPAIHPLSPMT